MIRLSALLLTLTLTLQASAADVTVQRRMETDASIERIITRVAWGAVEDVTSTGSDSNLVGLVGRLRGFEPRLWIDGQSRDGFFAWLAAVNRICGYAFDTQHAGSVEYDYRVRVRGYSVRRATRIEDGMVTLTTSTGWTETVLIGRLTRRIPIHVSFDIRATESGEQTLLVGAATGTADTAEFGCRIVRAIANRAAADELKPGLGQALATVERTGRGWYAGGSELGPVLDRLRSGINLGRRLRR